MSSDLFLATLLVLGGALETLLRVASGWMSAAFLVVIDIWIIVIVIVIIIIIIIIVIVFRRRK